MKLKFNWYSDEDVDGGLRPSCNQIDFLSDFKNCIGSLLTDNGGKGYPFLIPFLTSWVDIGIKQIEAIKMHETETAEWCGDSWGAELTNSSVKVYSLYDESYFDLMSLDSFEKVLRNWLKFIISEPVLDASIEFEV